MSGSSSANDGAQTPHRAELRLIGRPRCLDVRSGRWVDLSLRGAALLLMLVFEHELSRARLFGLLWPDSDEERARGSLRGLLRDLRVLAGVSLATGTIALRLADGVRHDLGALEGPVSGLDALPAGELLGGLDFTRLDEFLEWLAAARRRWTVARQRQLLGLAQQLDHQPEQALAVTERLLSDDPTDEAACELQMRLLYQLGRGPAALAAYARCAEAVGRDWHRDPSPGLRGLATLIELEGPVPARAAPAAPDTALTPARQVAREAEMAAVQVAWAAGRRVWLEGEPGIGKSRLLSELAAAEPAALPVAAFAGDVEVPFATLNRMLRALMTRGRPACEPEAASELARLLPELGARPTRPAHPSLLQQALAAALAAWRRQGVAALLLDDAQWADSASTALLMPALERCPDLRVLVAARPGSRAAVLGAAAPGWAVIEPRPLDAPGVAALLSAMGVGAVDIEAWAARLSTRALGSPLHVIETVRALRSRLGERVFRGPPPEAGEFPVPARLDELVHARLARLSAPARHMAQLAALAGGLFSVALARSVMGRNEMELAELWSALEAGQVLKDGGLSHDTLRDALLAAMPAAVARELHARVAEHGQAHAAAAAEIARHWRQAQAWEAAAEWYERAAQHALALNARAEEMQLWDEAAACLDRVGARARAHRARCAAAEAALTALPAAQARSRAQALPGGAEDDDGRLSALLVAARTAYVCHELDELVALSSQAKALAQGLRDAGLLPAGDDRLLQATCAHARGLAFGGEAERAVGELSGLEADLAAIGDTRAELAYRDAFGAVTSMAGLVDAATEAFLRCEQIARSLDDVAELQQQLTNVGVCHSRAGRYHLALRAVAETSELARRLGESRGVQGGIVKLVLGGLSARVGRYADALDAFGDAMAQFQESNALPWIADAETHAAGLWMDLGRMQDARQAMRTEPAASDDHQLIRAAMQLRLRQAEGQPSLEQAVALAAGYPRARMENRLVAQLLLAREQAAPDALATARAVGARTTSQGLRGIGQFARLIEIDALRGAGQAAQAAALATELLPALDEFRPFTLYFAEAYLIIARALSAARRHGDAEEALRRGRTWVLDEALPQVPHAYRSGFRTGNAVNRQLLAVKDATLLS